MLLLITVMCVIAEKKLQLNSASQYVVVIFIIGGILIGGGPGPPPNYAYVSNQNLLKTKTLTINSVLFYRSHKPNFRWQGDFQHLESKTDGSMRYLFEIPLPIFEAEMERMDVDSVCISKRIGMAVVWLSKLLLLLDLQK